MAKQAAGGDFRAAEAAREMAWEQLHSGPWHSVLPVWGDAYSMACLYVAKLHFANVDLRETLRVLDMGLIMGGMLLRRDLESVVQHANACIRTASSDTKASLNDQSKFCSSQNLSMAEVLHYLPIRSLSCKIVDKQSALSFEGFLRDYFLSGSPVIINDCMAHLPARTKLNDMNYLKKVASYRTIPGWQKLLMFRLEARINQISPVSGEDGIQ